jgi:hypothetical protein
MLYDMHFKDCPIPGVTFSFLISDFSFHTAHPTIDTLLTCYDPVEFQSLRLLKNQ